MIIEQAKGVLAERAQLRMSDAFVRLRSHARSSSQRLSELARQVVEDEPAARELVAGTGPSDARHPE